MQVNEFPLAQSGLPKLLAVSFAYPPLAYPRSIQVARLIKYLKAQTVLVCADEAGARKDLTLEPNAEVALAACLRVPFTVSKSRRLAHRLAYRLYRPLWNRWNQSPDQYGAWMRSALNAIDDYVHHSKYSPQVVTTFSQPVVDHLIGMELKKRLQVPWIAHFSDPWTDNPFNTGDAQSKSRNLYLEGQVMRDADRLIFTSHETVDLVMSKYPAEWKSKTRVLPQCFDPSLFPPSAEPRGPRLMVRHVGNFYGTRTPAPLTRALQALLVSDPSVLRDISFELIGVSNPTTLEQAALELPEGLVAVRPPVGYRESLALMTSADGLLIIDAPADVSVFLPSKLIDYIGAGRPVMGFTPRGASASLIRQLGGWVADPAEPDTSVATLKEFLSFLRHRRQSSAGTWGEPGVRSRYEVKRLAREFESIIGELLA